MSQLVVGLLLAVLGCFLLGGAWSFRAQGLGVAAVVVAILGILFLAGAGLYLVPYAMDL